MKRLFIIKHRTNPSLIKKCGIDCPFSDKMEAKKIRDQMNEAHKTKDFYVSRGPDHMGKHGHSLPRMRRQPKGKTA